MTDVNLRLLEKGDIERVRIWRNSENVSTYMYSDGYITEEQQLEWFEKIKNNENCIYWLIEFDAKPIGLASISGIDRTLSSCYWAFYLGDNSIRGKGIGAKVEFNVLEFVFNELRLNKLRCEVFVSNHKVISMHEKFGFRREAYYREHCIKKNTKHDVVGLAILKSEWEQLRTTLRDRIYS